MIKDITYCANLNCSRDCERNMSNKDFKGELVSMSSFNYLEENFNEYYCDYYLKEEK